MSEQDAPLAGVIGWPIAHSRSPDLHGHWLKRYGIRGWYIPLPVAPDDFARVVRTLPDMGFRGVNVTIPHKEAAFALADDVTDRARRLGAANTLSFQDGRIHADNTDGFGFVENLKTGASGWSAASGPALVLGAGGAARGVVAALQDAGAPEIRLVNRTRARAEALAADLGGAITVEDWDAAESAMAGAGLVVNTTALGMEGQPPLTLSLENAPETALATDIVYTPLETPFLKAAAARGLRTVDGLGMLLHQARPGFHAWFGVDPHVDEDLRRAVLGESVA